MLGVVIFGSLMYMAEGGPELNAFGFGGRWNSTRQVLDRWVSQSWDLDQQVWVQKFDESPFQSIPHACWWAMVTVQDLVELAIRAWRHDADHGHRQRRGS
mmetsp:Transcript_160129/g.513772  ORF Transcript_160129/g.513772 Transcript_160129/m.513772 type:complete len:100 (-) Transcript_160129:180-479(-)